jgi:hypothetical protein
MKNSIRIALASLGAVLSLAAVPVQSAEPTETMRTMARTFAALEARDQKGYCAAMHGASYAEYLNRVCQSAVQNRLKKPEDCSPENTARELKADTDKCLAMSAAEFEKKVLDGREGSKAFFKEMAAHGVDGEKLMQDARGPRAISK